MKKKLLQISLLICNGVSITGCSTLHSLSTADEQTKCGNGCNVSRIFSGTAVDICGLAADIDVN
ncbi:YceK/YidQ family lipoprotein [Geoanaerobacter pelophilus]|uniref:YceK/YidQ family lipoprotein n=1 Tax=Geoanaerobacter pelophilus TaxID=60036 RepID=UPI0011798DFD|nr:YceK/YidQ family lipoprotein [Geoanaerobacter pelophilus]